MVATFVTSFQREYQNLYSQFLNPETKKLDWGSITRGICWGLSSELIYTGVGGVRATQAVGQYLKGIDQQIPLREIVVSGYCGALDESISLGEIYCAKKVKLWSGEELELNTLNMKTLSEAQRINFLTCQNPVTSDTERKTWFKRTQCQVVDLESYFIARVSKEYGVDSYVLKGVIDNDEKSLVHLNQMAERVDNKMLEILEQYSCQLKEMSHHV